MSEPNQQPSTPLADAPRGEDYDKTTAALEPHIVTMQHTIDEAASRRNIALTTAAIMKAVG